MNEKPTEDDLKKLLGAVPDELRPTFEKVLSTVALQAQVIDDLLWKFEIYGGTEVLKKKIMGPVLSQLAAKLDNPTLKGPTLEEISGAIREMQDSIESATSAQNILQSVLGFALKVAPLVI